MNVTFNLAEADKVYDLGRVYDLAKAYDLGRVYDLTKAQDLAARAQSSALALQDLIANLIVLFARNSGQGELYEGKSGKGLAALLADIDSYVSQINSDIEDSVFQIAKAQRRLERSSSAVVTSVDEARARAKANGGPPKPDNEEREGRTAVDKSYQTV